MRHRKFLIGVSRALPKDVTGSELRLVSSTVFPLEWLFPVANGMDARAFALGPASAPERTILTLDNLHVHRRASMQRVERAVGD